MLLYRALLSSFARAMLKDGEAAVFECAVKCGDDGGVVLRGADGARYAPFV